MIDTWNMLSSHAWDVVSSFFGILSTMFTKPVASYIKDFWEAIGAYDWIIIGDIIKEIVSVIENLFVHNGVEVTLFEFLFTVGLPLYIVWVIAKWIVGIVTGS